ncbi:hypothetical protein Tco_0537056 [Tanacetum coccineum]
MIVKDISSIIDPRLSQVVLGRPFMEISNTTHEPPKGVVRFINGTDEVAYKMPNEIEQYNLQSDLEKEHIKSVYLRNEEDKRRGVEYVMSKILGFYKECLELGPEYVTRIDDEGEVTLYLMRRSLEILRKFNCRKAHLLEDKQIPSVGVFDEVFSIWKAFGGNTRDLGSFGEETDKTTDLYQHFSRVCSRRLETVSQDTRDAVTIHPTTVSQEFMMGSSTTTALVHDDVDDSGNRIEPGSHKEHLKVIDDDDENEKEKKDDEMGSLENRTEKMHTPIPKTPRSPRINLSSNKNFVQEVTDTVLLSTTTTSNDLQKERHISSKSFVFQERFAECEGVKDI